MDISAFTLSRHAIERALDMGIDADMIRECLTNPTKVLRSRADPDNNEYRRGKIICSVAPNLTVTTVIWSRDADWKRDLLDIGPYGGREYRDPSKAGATQ